MVYFVRTPGGLIKIGSTRDLAKRLRQLTPEFADQEGGEGLEVLGVVPGDRAEEVGLHARFRPHRIARELFRPHPDVMNFIADHAAPWSGVRDPPRRASTAASLYGLLDATELDALKAAAEADGVSVGLWYRRTLSPVVRAHLATVAKPAKQSQHLL